jgi:hypothetical protein
VPICTHCHPVVTARQRVYWFIQRVVTKTKGGDIVEVDEGAAAPGNALRRLVGAVADRTAEWKD